MTSLSMRLATGLLLIVSALPLVNLHAEEQAPASDAAETDAEPTQTIYIDMGKNFITQVGKPTSKLAYLKADVTLRVSSSEVQKAVDAHMPRLRHELVMLFGEQQDLDTLSSTQGQETLGSEARERINRALSAQRVEDGVQDVLFTTFVVQR
ncbi:flagellar basal body-associated FliL family protein [Marinobacter caseinilyticus]|uniref:flagellar basal body-associated FliL family protein n=1 Tax=Marinobacter caseinilyticus TaxID=2692195 RepID=UPI00140B647E|nr:flagellar basal body-associated FliL family protein [Marinobacter caseinilyticus]